ncbi:MAG: AbrB/MazE/SpoVT family DNA-binding domain-containing protein [Deltaproteobacteria bacterium]|nr:AbrB/MazE/SpoVT family DNA-binding domain-containing protein [Deltaproteobacteria bacterium]
MKKAKSTATECSANDNYTMESVVTIDERGQMVLPKEIRAKLNIHPGDKFALMTWNKGGRACCISLIKVEEMADIINGLLHSLIKGSAKAKA